MAPAIEAGSQPALETNILQKIGFLALAGFVFVFVSRLLDVRFPSLHVPLLLAVIAGVCAALAGRLHTIAGTRIGFWYAVLTAYFVAGVPFSIWRGGSVNILKSSWLRSLVIWAFIVGLTATYGEAKTLLNAVAMAAFTAGVSGLLLGTQSTEGRMVMAGGRLGNPNDFALVLLVGLPFLWRIYHGGGRPGLFRRMAALAAIAVVVVAFLRAGSRGGLYSLVFLIFLVVWRVSPAAKIGVTVAGFALLALALVVMPAHLRQRYFTLSSSEEGTAEAQGAGDQVEATAVGYAASSTESRRMLLRESLSITLHHPVFGVGVGNFPVYVYDLNKNLHSQQAWAGTHNTYTQLSSEAGIPAVMIFIGILVLSWRSLGRVIRATRQDTREIARDIHATAHATQVCLGAFAFFIVFAHVGYDILPHMIVALTVVVSRTAEAELQLIGRIPSHFATHSHLSPRSGNSLSHPRPIAAFQNFR